MGKKTKLCVRYDVELHGLSDIDESCDLNGIVIHWKRSGSSTGKGTSQPVLLHAPSTSFSPQRDRTRFSITCNYLRDPKTGDTTPEKKLKIALQTEDIARGKKGVFGKCAILLSPLSKDGHVAQLSVTLTDSPFPRPPVLHLTLRAYWETVDGFTLRTVGAGEDSAPPTKSGGKKLRETAPVGAFSREQTSMFPTRKVTIEGKVYELYESNREVAADNCPSFRSVASGADTDIEFSCDEIDEDDDEDVDEGKKAAVPLRKPKKEAKPAELRRTGLTQITSSTANVQARFEVTVLSAERLPVGSEGKGFYVSWRRGSKKKNSGKTSTAVCTEGDVQWTSLSEEPITVRASLVKDLKTQKYLEKSLALSLKRHGGGHGEPSFAVGHLIIDLADFGTDGGNTTRTFELVARPSAGGASKRKSLMRSISGIRSEKGHVPGSQKSLAMPRTKSTGVTAEAGFADAAPLLELNITCEFLESDIGAAHCDSDESDDGVARGGAVTVAAPPVAKALNVFELPLLDQLIHNGVRIAQVPPVFVFLAEGIEKMDGLDREGIFRLSGRTGLVQDLMDALKAAKPGEPLTVDLAPYGPHELADVLKKYLRALKDSLMPEAHYEDYLALGQEYIQLNQSKEYSAQRQLEEKLRLLLTTLPPANTATSRVLFSLLHKTQARSAENKMHAENLATVFAPTLVQKDFDDPGRFLADNSKKVGFIKLLLDFSPRWEPIADFSEIDKKLLENEVNLSPRVRVVRMEEKLARSRQETEEVRGQLAAKEAMVSRLEYMELILSTPTHFNVTRKRYQAALDIEAYLRSEQIFDPVRPAFLYTTVHALRLLHRRTVRDLHVNSFWLSVCMDLLELWQDDEDLLFCGNAKRLGLAAAGGELEYQPRMLERWEPEESAMQSSSHFEQQFQAFTRVVFYSLCRNFVEENEPVLTTLCDSSSVFDDSQGESPQEAFIAAAARYLGGVQKAHLSDVVISQVVRGMFRESTRFLQHLISQRKDLCGVEAGLKLKMNWTMVLHGIREDQSLSVFRGLVEEEMQPLQGLANLLVTMGNFSADLFPDGAAVLEMFPSLDPEAVADILELFTGLDGADMAQSLLQHKAKLIDEIRAV